MLNHTMTLKTINQGRNAVRRGDTVKGQAILKRAADALGMGWILWSCPMPSGALLSASLEMLKAVDPEYKA